MTTPSRDGRDKPFSDWLRLHPGLDSHKCSLDTPDIDHTFHKFKSWVDGLGDRKIKLMMDVEIKTFGKGLSFNQQETIFFHHQLLKSKRKLYSSYLKSRVTVWSFGHFVLVIFGGDRPDKCERMEWGCFDEKGNLLFKEIADKTLVNILGFTIRPDNFTKLTLRRHHKTSVFGYEDHSPDLLFPMARQIMKRS